MTQQRQINWLEAQLRARGLNPIKLPANAPDAPPEGFNFKARHPFHMPCGYHKPESDYRDPDTGAHRSARCEGPQGLIVRGDRKDSTTNGRMFTGLFMGGRACPNAEKES